MSRGHGVVQRYILDTLLGVDYSEDVLLLLLADLRAAGVTPIEAARRIRSGTHRETPVASKAARESCRRAAQRLAAEKRVVLHRDGGFLWVSKVLDPRVDPTELPMWLDLEDLASWLGRSIDEVIGASIEEGFPLEPSLSPALRIGRSEAAHGCLGARRDLISAWTARKERERRTAP